MFKSILVPLDGSPMAESALEPALAMAQAFSSNINLVRVLPRSNSADYIVDINLHQSVHQREHAQIEEYLETVALRCSKQGATVNTHLLEAGDPAERIREYTETTLTDLIVLSSHGRTGLARVVLGSVAEHISRTAVCPVMIIRPKIKETSND